MRWRRVTGSGPAFPYVGPSQLFIAAYHCTAFRWIMGTHERLDCYTFVAKGTLIAVDHVLQREWDGVLCANAVINGQLRSIFVSELLNRCRQL